MISASPQFAAAVKRTVTRQEIADCLGCRADLRDNPGLPGACASVGIEHGLSTAYMMFRHLAAFHFRGHE